MTSTFSAPSAHAFAACLLAVLVGFGMYFDHAASDGIPEQSAAGLENELARASASPDVRRVAHWAVSTRDYAGMPFVVIDRSGTRIYAFDSRGHLVGSAPVLAGVARADETAPPATPAGRFVIDTIASARDGAIVWANAQTQFTLRALPAALAGELDSQRAQDKIPDRSLRVAAGFYGERLEALRNQPSIAYVLPETASLEQVFGMGPASPAAVIERGIERARSPS